MPPKHPALYSHAAGENLKMTYEVCRTACNVAMPLASGGWTETAVRLDSGEHPKTGRQPSGRRVC